MLTTERLFSGYIFARDRLPFAPIDEARATVISCAESRKFLSVIGINGEIISTPSHSMDSISFVLDDGDCFVGDLQPREYGENADWARVMEFQSRRVFYSHAN